MVVVCPLAASGAMGCGGILELAICGVVVAGFIPGDDVAWLRDLFLPLRYALSQPYSAGFELTSS